ncbi:MAG: flavin reductase family protein [Bacteroidetes bacterium]|nr:MAG: flavin reductase family protein [Bacteroidota bacterium]
MAREIGTFDAFAETMECMQGDGILLVAGYPPNPMTIGWGSLGVVWSRPVFQVLVRPTRYTFGLMEEGQAFTVNIFSEKFNKELSICGTHSGKDLDKAAACGFTMVKGEQTTAFYIRESKIHYECRIIHKHLLDPATLDPAIIERYYPLRDFHMVYYGEIAGVYRN